MIKFQSTIYLFSTALVSMLFTGVAFAKEISLYDEPKDNSKIVGKIDIEAGVVPIFSAKSGDWMKVGDPRNGNVGWIKVSDTQTPGQPNAISFTQKVINDSKGGQHSYQLMQYGKPAQTQSDEIIKKMEQQQAVIYDSMQKTFQDVMIQMKNVNDWNKAHGMPEFPMWIPMMVTPSSLHPSSHKSSTATKPNQEAKKQ